MAVCEKLNEGRWLGYKLHRANHAQSFVVVDGECGKEIVISKDLNSSDAVSLRMGDMIIEWSEDESELPENIDELTISLEKQGFIFSNSGFGRVDRVLAAEELSNKKGDNEQPTIVLSRQEVGKPPVRFEIYHGQNTNTTRDLIEAKAEEVRPLTNLVAGFVGGDMDDIRIKHGISNEKLVLRHLDVYARTFKTMAAQLVGRKELSMDDRQVVNIIDLGAITPEAIVNAVKIADFLGEPMIVRVGAVVENQEIDLINRWCKLISKKYSVSPQRYMHPNSVPNSQLILVLKDGLMMELAKREVIGDGVTMPEERNWISSKRVGEKVLMFGRVGQMPR
jgi:hypothetical protein